MYANIYIYILQGKLRVHRIIIVDNYIDIYICM